jgi:hypothetical protein
MPAGSVCWNPQKQYGMCLSKCDATLNASDQGKDTSAYWPHHSGLKAGVVSDWVFQYLNESF